MRYILQIIFLIISIIIIRSELYVTSPEELQNQFSQGIPVSMSTFGQYKYGHTINGILVMGSTQDSKKEDETNKGTDGCGELQHPFQNWSKKNMFEKHQYFLMVDRGNCTFLQKAINAQKAGATMLIVADNDPKDMPEDHILVGEQDDTKPHLIMPTVMISKKNADRIKEFYSYKEENFKQINMAFKMNHPNRTEVAHVELWNHPFDFASYKFLKQFESIYKSIGDKSITFIPKHYMWSCFSCKQYGFKKNDSNGECVSGGRYCAKDPDGKGLLQGKDVVWQYLRSTCAYQQFGAEKWIRIQIQFFENCVQKKLPSTKQEVEDCYYNNLENVVISQASKGGQSKKETIEIISKYHECINNSWKTNQNISPDLQDNTILSDLRDQAQKDQVQYTPTLFVNGMRFYGDIEEKDSTEEIICEAYQRKSQPKECIFFNKEFESFHNPKGASGKKESNTATIIIIVTCAFVVVILFLWLLKRNMKKGIHTQMQSQVSDSVNRYFSMADKSHEVEKY